MKKIDGHYCRRFGDENTHLTLTKKADRFYSETDPINIYEREIDVENVDGEIIGSEYLYAIDGSITTKDWTGRFNWITEAEVNEILEANADDCAEITAQDYFWTMEAWGSDYPPENADEIIQAANEKITEFVKSYAWRDVEEIWIYSDKLWEEYCRTGKI